jgi:hypothetical protein
MSTQVKKRAMRVQATEISPGHVTVHFVSEGVIVTAQLECSCTKSAVRKSIERLGYLCKAKSIMCLGPARKEAPPVAEPEPTEPMLPVEGSLSSVDPRHPHWNEPTPVSDWDMTFGGMAGCMDRILPPWDDIPPLFQKRLHAWCHFWDKAFFNGASLAELKPVEGVVKVVATRHLKAIINSMEPSHEHKIAAVAWLSFKWFKSDPPGGAR